MNSLDASILSRRYVKFAEEDGLGFYFDTGRIDERGECPVVIRADWRVVEVANDFVDFLCSNDAGPEELMNDAPHVAEALAAPPSDAQNWAP